MLSALHLALLKSSLLGVGLFQLLRQASLWLTRVDFIPYDDRHGLESIDGTRPRT